MKLYTFYSNKKESLGEEHIWQPTRAMLQRCPTCTRSRPNLYPAPFVVSVRHRQRGTESFSGRACIQIYKQELFRRLRERCDWVVPGPVTMLDGRELKGSVTVHFDPSKEIPLRGGHEARYHVCKTCGKVSIDAGSPNPMPWYVLRRDLPDDHGVYHVNHHSGVLLREDIVKAMRFEDFPDLVLEPVLVLDEPIVPVPELGDPVA